MSSSLMSSPVRANPSGTGSPGFRSQKKLSAGTIMKKIQTLEDTIESLRQQLVFTRSEEEQISNAISKRKTNTNPKQPKQPKETKAKEPKEPKQPKETKPKESKETKAATEDKDKIPMPWTGIADFTACVGLKAQYGLFIQCGKACDATSASFQIDNHECRFCNECAKKCDENGKHPVGTIEERIEAGVGKYVNAKTGKKETAYIEVLEKMGITKEQALESAQKRGFQIPDWMLEKTEKKRGRPGKNTENVASEGVVENQEKQEKQEKPKKEPKQKEPKQKQPPRSKKTASVTTFDTPQKVSTTKDSAQSSVCIDLNDVATLAVVTTVAVVAPQEKKKRGRPTKSNTENNVDVDEMQQLIIQATTEKKKRLSLDAEVMPSDESENSLHPETQLTFNGQENKSKSEDVESDEVFEMFDEMIRNEEQEQQEQQEQQVIKEVVKKDVKEPAKKKKGSEEAAAKEAAKEAAKKKKEEEAAAKEAAKEAAKKKKEEEAAAKEAAKKKKELEAAAVKEAAKKKQEEEAAAAKEAAKKKQEEESEETEDEEDEDDEEEDEELECEEYEYEGETYGLAPNGDIYSQDGELVGRMNNGVPKMFD